MLTYLLVGDANCSKQMLVMVEFGAEWSVAPIAPLDGQATCNTGNGSSHDMLWAAGALARVGLNCSVAFSNLLCKLTDEFS